MHSGRSDGIKRNDRFDEESRATYESGKTQQKEMTLYIIRMAILQRYLNK
jgi:hypothetical protein